MGVNRTRPGRFARMVCQVTSRIHAGGRERRRIDDQNPAQDEKPELYLDQPEDRSLAAFKRFINDMMEALGGNMAEGSLTEEQWVAKWKKFWEDEGADR